MRERFFPIAFLTMTLLASPLAAEEMLRQIAVGGNGDISVAPDRANVSLGVEMRARELQAARDEVSKVVTDFLSLAKKLDIDKESLNTSQLTIRPEYEWIAAARKRRLTGYYVARQISVDLKDLEKLGPLLERATELGINNVSGPYFSSSREAELKRVALKRAAEDARRNAEVIAMTLGATLGPVRSVQAQGASLPPPRPQLRMESMSMAADSGGAEESYEAGEIKLTSQVNAVFDLLIAQ
ncbi:MAG: SIMPL domain-containing protein [Gammaproteobacteria bacterium]|nr:SIMPL domain-containing protein [Gammaproteobacteria bacterium]